MGFFFHFIIMRLLPLLSALFLLLPMTAWSDEDGEGGKKSGGHRLAESTSPYLRQHATNPVAWYPWGKEAFQAARERNVPIFLSVGYSTCHWCHVMERESFEDEEIAAIMNENFVNIKVDREQRPDIDETYMTFVQATTGQGGWPMSVWLTPDLKPFFGGTYFPPGDADGRPGFPSIMRQISAAWQKDEKRIREDAGSLTKRLQELMSGDEASAELPPPESSKRAFEDLSEAYDEQYGGFGSAPKFPVAAHHHFLHHYARQVGPDTEAGRRALAMSTQTLRTMARGGIYDHLGEGFHRYSVDRFWHIPHYEKMLYDQGQLVPVYLEAAELTGEAAFVETARGILAYVQRQMTHPEGGFYSAEDADSLASPEADHKSEGAFYIWRKSEIDRLLGKQAPLFCEVYGIREDGNAPEGSDPLGKLTGTNTLIRRYSDEAAAEKFSLSAEEVAKSLASSRELLFEARLKRPRPLLDDKILTSWNGLMISAFARAYQQLGDGTYLERAEKAAEFLRAKMSDKDSGRLQRAYRKKAAGIEGFAADYAFLIRGLLDLYEAGFDTRWLRWALELQEQQNELFEDAENGGFFSHSGRDESVLLRTKDIGGSMPSLNAVSARNLFRLGAMLGRADFRERGEKTIRAFGVRIKESPTAVTDLLVALDLARGKPAQVIIAGDPEAADTRAMIALARQHAPAGSTLLLADGGKGQKFLGTQADFYQSIKPLEGKATAFVCRNFTCQLPTNDPGEFVAQLEAFSSESQSKGEE